MRKDLLNKALIAGIFSIVIIGTLSFLTNGTDLGLFLVASFGSSMVLVLGYPESPFAKGRNVLFGHVITSLVGLICYAFFVVELAMSPSMIIPIAVGLGIFFMILSNSTHPPAGGNPIIVILGGYSFDFLITPIISGCLIIIIQAYIINNYILKKEFKLF